MVEGKVAMLGVAEREERRMKYITGHRMLSAGKKFHPEMLTQPSIKIQTARQKFQGLEH